MTGDTRRGTHLELPIELIEEMKSLDEDMWRVVTEALRVYLGAGADSVAALRRQADLLDDQIAELNDEIQSLQAERDEKIGRRDRITDRIEQIKADRREYEEILDDIIESLVENPSLNLASQRSELEAAAEIRKCGTTRQIPVRSDLSTGHYIVRVTNRANTDAQPARSLHRDGVRIIS